jgi:hypothetical protein
MFKTANQSSVFYNLQELTDRGYQTTFRQFDQARFQKKYLQTVHQSSVFYNLQELTDRGYETTLGK